MLSSVEGLAQVAVVTGVVFSLFICVFSLLAVLGRMLYRLPVRPHLIPLLASALLPAWCSATVLYEPRYDVIGLLCIVLSWTIGMSYAMFLVPSKLWWWNLWVVGRPMSDRKSSMNSQ